MKIELISKKIIYVFNISGKDVKITFENKKFESAEFNFHGVYDKTQWDILGTINNLIKYIEKKLNKEK